MELLLYRCDEASRRPALTISALARRPCVGDLIVYKPDRWPWSWRELSDAEFRILRVELPEFVCQQLMSVMPRPVDSASMSYTRYRNFHFGIEDSRLQDNAAIAQWWNDDARTISVFEMSAESSSMILKNKMSFLVNNTTLAE